VRDWNDYAQLGGRDIAGGPGVGAVGMRTVARGHYMMKRAAQIGRWLLLASLWILVMVASTEILLRAFVETRPFNYAYDGDWGWRPAAGSRIVWGREGFGHISYVADGELATPYNDGLSIVVLGDSHTQAYQVNSRDNFVSVAETLLRQRGVKADLHNLGRSSTALPDYIYLAQSVTKRYAPRLVIIQISEGDFQDRDAFNPQNMNYFVRTGGELTVRHTSPPFQDHWLGKIMNRTTLITEGVRRYSELRASGEETGIAVASEPEKPVSGLAETADLQLQALQKAYAGIPVIILALPYVPTVSGSRVITESATYQAMLDAARAVPEWTVVDPLPEFQRMLTANSLPRGFHNTAPGFGHLNLHGHAAVGAVLADAIEEALR
jgi:lysophospholipase L1-like esterase